MNATDGDGDFAIELEDLTNVGVDESKDEFEGETPPLTGDGIGTGEGLFERRRSFNNKFGELSFVIDALLVCSVPILVSGSETLRKF
jgi:hypothetical protein